MTALCQWLLPVAMSVVGVGLCLLAVLVCLGHDPKPPKGA